MPEIYSYVSGQIQKGCGKSVPLLNPATEETVATTFVGGFDQTAAYEFARTQGCCALAGLDFAARGEMLKKMAGLIHEHRDDLIETSVINGGTTRSGAKFDIDGAAGTLAAYAEIAANMAAGPYLPDGEGELLGRGARLMGRHVYVPRQGVAVLINAFNFPAWGFAEKAATALLAGMPVIFKPATATSLTAGRLAELLVQAEIMPEGAFSMALGRIDEMFNALGPQDFVAFTGSSRTGALIRSNEHLVRFAVPVNVEADSLNAAVLGPETDPDSDCYQLFLRDVVREMTEKTGQKCTATRRLIVPENLVERVAEDLWDRLSDVKVGDPSAKEVQMGPVATKQQMQDVHAGIDRLRDACSQVYGANRPTELIDVHGDKGFFVGPILAIANDARALEEVHRDEVFGPVASILPYDGTANGAIGLVRRGGGMLVSSVYADQRQFLRECVLGIANYCGRVVAVDSKAEGFSLPTGMVLPQLIHGGPGRAGGGEELGGVRGVQHFLHRVAIQGPRAFVERMF